MHDEQAAAITDSAEYKRLCETVSLFCRANNLDEKSREQLSGLVAIAMRIGSSFAN